MSKKYRQPYEKNKCYRAAQLMKLTRKSITLKSYDITLNYITIYKIFSIAFSKKLHRFYIFFLHYYLTHKFDININNNH